MEFDLNTTHLTSVCRLFAQLSNWATRSGSDTSVTASGPSRGVTYRGLPTYWLNAWRDALALEDVRVGNDCPSGRLNLSGLLWR